MLFFFFKQKTSYEMRISYWSADVCSSDLRWRPGRGQTSSSTCWDGRLTAGACEHCQSQGWQGWANNRPCPDVLSHRRSRRRVSDLRQRRRTAVPGTLEHGREPDPL